MEEKNHKTPTCQVCGKNYSRVSARNKHLREFHNEYVPSKKIRKHIKCPLCSEDTKEPFGFGYRKDFIQHLRQVHILNVKESNLYFSKFEEFETWKKLGDFNYVCRQKTKNFNKEVVHFYECNRSNTKGFVSNCKKRRMKKGGSIKISGYCPSRIIAKITDAGVQVQFTETHVGHEDKLRSKDAIEDQQKESTDSVPNSMLEFCDDHEELNMFELIKDEFNQDIIKGEKLKSYHSKTNIDLSREREDIFEPSKDESDQDIIQGEKQRSLYSKNYIHSSREREVILQQVSS